MDEIERRKGFSEAKAKIIVTKILQAMQHCHDKSIVHMDLKNENILLDQTRSLEKIKVADFGLAVRMPEGRKKG